MNIIVKKIWLGTLYNEAIIKQQKNGLENSLKWLKNKVSKNPFDVDAQMAYRDLLDINNRDSLIKKAEIEVHDTCAKIIRDKTKQPVLLVAKAYAYRAELSSLGVDRHRNAKSALDILFKFEVKDEEVTYLIDMCESIIDGHGRPIILRRDEIIKY
ncbi:MAG: hypothetical protein NTX61_12985 [Bacteroidetes bacterium]|nr:hypothetical protein [Bacteroidota bacterium]